MAKVRLAKFRGLLERAFRLHLKETAASGGATIGARLQGLRQNPLS